MSQFTTGSPQLHPPCIVPFSFFGQSAHVECNTMWPDSTTCQIRSDFAGGPMKNASEKVLVFPRALPSHSMTIPASSRLQLTLKVPFAFTVGSQILPPGQYYLEPQMSCDSDRNVVVICSTDGEIYHASCATNIPLTSPSRTGHAVFERVGGQLYLSEIQAAQQPVLIRLDSGAAFPSDKPQLAASGASQRLELKLISAVPTSSPVPLLVVSPHIPQL